MTKWMVGLLLLANLALFGWMRWGNLLTVDTDAVAMQAALNPEKIKLLELQSASAAAASAPAASGVPLTLSPAAASSVAVVSAPVATETVAKPAASNCAEWGEFSGDDLARATQSLGMLKLGNKLSERTVEQDHGYWVYIPPLKKRAQREQKIGQLISLGVKEYFVVQEKGQWLNAISLGVFKSQEAAQKYLAALQEKGIRPVKLGERKSKLKFTIFVMKGLDTATVDKLNGMQKGFPDSELKVSACPI